MGSKTDPLSAPCITATHMEEFIERADDGSVDFEAALRRAVAVVSRLRDENRALLLAARAPSPEPAPQPLAEIAATCLLYTSPSPRD